MSNERVSFIDTRLSEELKPAVKLLQKIDRAVFRKFLKGRQRSINCKSLYSVILLAMMVDSSGNIQ